MADPLLNRLNLVLAAMGAGPRNLPAWLKKPGPDEEEASQGDVDKMVEVLLSSDPNDQSRLLFSNLLRSWDNQPTGEWIDGTPRNTADRRRRIHELLKIDIALQSRIDSIIPFFSLDEPIVVAAEHLDWYEPRLGVRDYYWQTYRNYLRSRRGWPEESILSLDNTTRAIVECMADPEAKGAYSSRGLVMGYVQSGKTANFLGVVARAADAGYRLIIVLAGTWNILRNQTQRRFDKELLGKELLVNDTSYTAQMPRDWNEFLEHGADPSAALGHFHWQRLTRPNIDFRSLKSAIDNLEFEKRDRSVPLYAPVNLHVLPAKLLVIKKHSGILAKLVADLRVLRTRLTDLPTLVIDDESDQAGLNTVDPTRARSDPGKKERSKTNQRISDLLMLFPRAQYIGYSATPYANALVDPDDPEDLFPKDFIVSLERPLGYMGVSDFFDPTANYSDLDNTDWREPEIAFIRRVGRPVGEDDEDLKHALRSYVLAGAIKLFRHGHDPVRYAAKDYVHHTMLIHTSPRTGEHASLAGRLEALWDQCAFNSPKGLSDLEQLWLDDFRNVCGAHGTELVPSKFSELHLHLSEALRRIELGKRVFLVLNSDSKDAPDFSESPVWKIIIGGNKLSRGYTVEGLTVSYYRRVAGAADTLMQMGRWFGFRPGYRDLIRVYLGVADGRNGESDLVALLKDVCRMEERFREELRRYVRVPGGRRITPKEIPPLISMSGALPPTSRNKMFNSRIESKNFGGQISMLTLAPREDAAMTNNIKNLGTLLSEANAFGRMTLGGATAAGDRVNEDALIFECEKESVEKFLEKYQWLETDYKADQRPADTSLQIEFLRKAQHGIKSWLIIAPQRSNSFGDPLPSSSGLDFAVKKRSRVGGRGFQVFGEPKHRSIARYVAGIASTERPLTSPNNATGALRNVHRAVLLLYAVREEEAGPVSVGFELLFPENDLPRDINFTVRRRAETARVVVDVNGGG